MLDAKKPHTLFLKSKGHLSSGGGTVMGLQWLATCTVTVTLQKFANLSK